MVFESILWCEDERPRTIAACVLPGELKKTFQMYVSDKKIPNILLVGSSGTGKTTVARAMCEEIGCDYMFINGSDERGIDVLRTKIKSYASSMSLSGGPKVVIIDEADGLTAECQNALRGFTEIYSDNCTFILTANIIGNIIEPLKSRFAVIPFVVKNEDKTKIAATFFKKVIGILEKHEIEFEAKVVAEVIQRYFPDFRKTINELQRYATHGKIDTGILAMISDVSVKELLGFLKAKDFGSMRRWVGLNIDQGTRLYKKFDEHLDSFTPDTRPEVIVLLAKYDYQQAFSTNPQIQMTAFLTELMIQAKFQ